jgi:hypothetical protein
MEMAMQDMFCEHTTENPQDSAPVAVLSQSTVGDLFSILSHNCPQFFLTKGAAPIFKAKPN